MESSTAQFLLRQSACVQLPIISQNLLSFIYISVSHLYFCISAVLLCFCISSVFLCFRCISVFLLYCCTSLGSLWLQRFQMCSFAQRSEMQAKNRIHKKTKKKAQLGIEQGQKACVTASARVWYLEPKWLRCQL